MVMLINKTSKDIFIFELKLIVLGVENLYIGTRVILEP